VKTHLPALDDLAVCLPTNATPVTVTVRLIFLNAKPFLALVAHDDRVLAGGQGRNGPALNKSVSLPVTLTPRSASRGLELGRPERVVDCAVPCLPAWEPAVGWLGAVP